MLTPTVTELARVLESASADTFIAGQAPVVLPSPVRARRIVD